MAGSAQLREIPARVLGKENDACGSERPPDVDGTSNSSDRTAHRWNIPTPLVEWGCYRLMIHCSLASLLFPVS